MYLLIALTRVGYFYDGFNDLTGWMSTGGGWRVDSSAPLPPPGDGGFAIVSGSSPPVRDTLISPPIAVSPVPLSLSFVFSYAFASVGGDTGSVLVRYFVSGSWGGWTTLRTYTVTSSGRDTVSLSVADSVQVAFLYSSSNVGLYFAVDDVSIFGEVDAGKDWEAVGIETPTYAFKDSTFTVGYRVRNNSPNTDTALVIYGATSLRSGTTNVVLPAGADTLIPMELTVNVPGYVVLYLVVSAPSDTFAENDTLTVSLRIYPNPSLDITSIPVSSPPLVDGVVKIGSYTPPWDSAGRVPAAAWMDGAPVEACTLLTVNTQSEIYFALILSADLHLDPGDVLIMAVDDDSDGFWAPDSSEGWNVLYPVGWYTTPDPGSVQPSFRLELGSDYAFYSDPSLAYRVQVEWKMDIGREPDPSSIPADRDTVRMAVLYRSGEDNRVICRWPQNADPYVPNTFGTLILVRGLSVQDRYDHNLAGGIPKVYAASGRFVGYSLEGLPPGVYFVLRGKKVERVIVR